MRISDATQDGHLCQRVSAGAGEGKGFPNLNPGNCVLGLQLAFGWSCSLVLVIMPTRSQAQSVMRRLQGWGGHTQVLNRK